MPIFAFALFDYLVFVLTFFSLVLLPGYLLARLLITEKNLAWFGKALSKNFRPYLNRYFYFLFAPATGLVFVNFLMIFLDYWQIKFSFWSLTFFSLFCLIAGFFFVKKQKSNGLKKSISTKKSLFLLLALIWIFTVTIRVLFYLPDVLPQDTDLGHHMYFSQNIVSQGKVPAYDTAEVIIGEHLIFAFLSITTNISLLSALPLILLAFFNLLTALSIAFFTFVLTGKSRTALLALAFFGAYYTIDPPQGRYVNGGVVGNTFGNYLICSILILVFLFGFSWFKSLKQDCKKIKYSALSSILALILILLVGILYTHHLSSFLLLFNLFFFFLFWLFATFFILKKESRKISQHIFLFVKNLFFSPQLIFVLIFIFILTAFVYLPFYLENNAVETVAREPLKASHTGIEWASLPGKFGWLKIIFSVFGLALIFKNFSWLKFAFVFSWFLPLFLLSFFPQIFNISIPSRRVATYLIFPLTVLSAYGLAFFLSAMKTRLDNRRFILVLFILIAIFLFDGTKDFRSTYSSLNKFQETVELYEASKYLAEKTETNSVMLKDHSTLSGDSWIKFFLQRGYDYFISRTYDYKYETVDPYNEIDTCPREMIIVPDSKQSKSCYGQTQTNYVILKPKGDDFLFWKSDFFDPIYSSESIAIFKVKTENN